MKKNKKSIPLNKEAILADKDKLSTSQISKKYNLPIGEIKNIINASSEKHQSERKTPKWFYAALVLLPIIFLIALEIFLRIINYGYNFDQWLAAGEGKYVINPNIGKKYFTAGSFNPTTSEDYFDINKKANSFRVFVLGESSAEGYPFSPMGSFPRYVRRRLELVYPNTTIEVINIGMTAINSYTLLDLIPGVLEQKPDLILIYTGHNEYYGALGVGSVQSYGSSRTLIKLMLHLNDLKITQFVRNSMNWFISLFISENKKTSGTLMSNMAKDQYILLNSEVFNAGLEQFRENLSDILQLIKDKGIPVILGRLVSNLKDQKPFISANTSGYKNADIVYKEAESELQNKNLKKADSLFRLAKDLDALRFRAPEEINKIIEDLGRKYHVAAIPIDSLFNAASPEGIAGDNLIVDHLHPNVKGYQIIGKAFYDCMDKLMYLPKTENAKIPFIKQDSLTCANYVFSNLDSTIGRYNITLLKNNWPYTQKKDVISEFQDMYFENLFKPKDFIDSIAMFKIEGKVSWTDAHLMAASVYLRKDDIKNYLKHINILIDQYPILSDFNTAIKYFYQRNKLNPADYTTKRVGIISLYTGRTNDAIRLLTATYKLNPNDPLVLYNLSLAYSEKKDFKTALTIVNKCLKIKPNYPDANKLKQQIFVQLKN